MSLTGWSLDNFLNRNAGVFTGLSADTNLLLSAWVWIDDVSGGGRVVNLGIQGQVSNAHSRGLFAGNDGSGTTLWAEIGKTNQAASSSGGGAEDTWHHVGGSCIGDSLLEAWLNGGGKGSDASTSNSANVSDQTRIGRSQHTSGGDAFQGTGAIAGPSIWDVTGFTETNRDDLDALLATASPLAPNPLAINAQVGQPWEGKLLAYWRLTDNTDVADLAGNGHDLTLIGSLSTFGSDPPVDPVPGVVLEDMLLAAAPVSAARTDLSWTNPLGTDAVRVLRRGPPSDLLLAENFVGTNGAPWAAARWVDESIGTAFTEIDTNRGQMTTADVGTDEVRVRLLDSEGQPLVLDKVGVEFRLEPPHGTGLTASVGYGFGIQLRHVGGAWATVAHDPENGYRLIVYRGDTSDDFSVAIARSIDGVVTFPEDNGITIPGATVDAVNVRVEAAGDRIRMLVRDAAAGPLPADEWDIDVIDDTFESGQVSISVRGPTGGSSPDRTGYIDGLRVYSSDFELISALEAVEAYVDSSPYGLLPDTQYDYQVFASDSGEDVGFGESSAITPAAPVGAGGGPLLGWRIIA